MSNPITFVEILKNLKDKKKVKFDETLECKLKLNLSEKNKKDSIRFSVVFPTPFEKGKRVIVLTDAQNYDEAKKAGADEVGLEELVAKLNSGWSEFDVVIASPSVMPKISSLGKVLGPKGLMPNPKNETVTTDLKRVIGMYKKGKIDFKADSTGVISMKFGKLSMKEEDLKANLSALLKELYSTVSKYGDSSIKSITIKSSMSPSYDISIAELKSLTK